MQVMHNSFENNALDVLAINYAHPFALVCKYCVAKKVQSTLQWVMGLAVLECIEE